MAAPEHAGRDAVRSGAAAWRFLVPFIAVIWIAENVGALTRTWIYPSQANGGSLVAVGKLGSWFLLLILSWTLVVMVKRKDLKRAIPCA